MNAVWKILIVLLFVSVLIVVIFIAESVRFNRYVSNVQADEFKIPVNENAPVVSHGSIGINAPVEAVWAVLTGINKWPEWQEEVTSASLAGEAAEEASFEWEAGGIGFTSKIHTMQANKYFGWTGSTTGAMAVHNWSFVQAGDSTLVKVDESLQGVFPLLLKQYFQKNLDKGIKNSLNELKAAVESGNAARVTMKNK